MRCRRDAPQDIPVSPAAASGCIAGSMYAAPWLPGGDRYAMEKVNMLKN
jgi:hypothetical protein